MRHFLLIDDEEVFNMVSKYSVEMSGLAKEIDAFTSAEKALEFIENKRRNKEKCDFVILLDIRMPVMDGFEFLDEFSKYKNDECMECDVYMLSSSIDSSDIEKAGTYPFVKGYLSKPLTPEAMDKIKETVVN